MTTATKQQMSTKTAVRLLCVAIALVLVSCIGASALQTDFGRVRVTKFSIPTGSGKWISGTLFQPKSASVENKIPLVITSHGYLNNNQMQDITGIELSRRGIAVMAMDAYFHGDSSANDTDVFHSMDTDGLGMISLVEYAYYNLDYVDNNRIGVMGHSMGGGSTWSTLTYYGSQQDSALEAAKEPDSDGGIAITPTEEAFAKALNKVAAGFPTSAATMASEEVFQHIHANVGINFGYYDEGAVGMRRAYGDMAGDCYESLSTINSIMPYDSKVANVEVGRFYGDAKNGTLRIIYNPKEIHPWQHFSVQSAAYTAEFFTTAFEMQNPIPLENQLWLWKEIFNFIGLIGSFLAIVPLAVLLLRVPIFSNLRGSVPPALPALSTPQSKIVFWGSWTLSWLVSWLLFLPVTGLDIYLFPGPVSMSFAKWFPQHTTNFIMLWAVFNGLVGLLLFWLSYKLQGEKNGVSPKMWGIRTNLREFLKTLALAVCVFIGFYSFVMFSEYFFHTDFRIWTLDIRAFTADKLFVAFQYWPFFFIFYAANSILVNSANRLEGQKEWFNLLVCGLGNCLGIIIMNLIQYGTLFATGVTFTEPGMSWLYVLVTIPMIPQLFVAVYISRYLFKETGKVWLGAMVNCLILVMMSVANTCTMIPLA